jgi:hypothetical protein
MGFEFVQSGLDFPALMIERSQLGSRGSFVIHNRSQQSVDRLATSRLLWKIEKAYSVGIQKTNWLME